ncbi:MAG: tetratricopeptide repeat protein [Myxococcales bacterium]|nr:tetratricopeptide repeat protein [Myxococcales bacterium]
MKLATLAGALALLLVAPGCGEKKKPANPNDVKSAKKAGGGGGDNNAAGNNNAAGGGDNNAAKPAGGGAATPAKPAGGGGDATPAPAADDGPKPVAQVRAAESRLQAGRYQDAIFEAKRALQRSEKYIPAMVVMAKAYYRLGKLGFAEAVCNRALDIKKSIGACYEIYGHLKLKENDQQKALANFKKATEVDPAYASAWLNYGALELRVKNYDAAIRALEQATSKLPSQAEAHLNLGAAYRGSASKQGAGDAAKTLAKARRALLKALSLRSNYASALFNLGILYLDANANFDGKTRVAQLDQAINYFKQYKTAGRLQPNDPVDDYIKNAERAKRRAERAARRATRRKDRDAAKKATKKTPKKKK